MQPIFKAGSAEAWKGCSVILDINDGDRVIFSRLTPRATVDIGGRKCSLQPLVGRPFGSTFRVEPCDSEGGDYSGVLVSYATDAPSRDDDPTQDGKEHERRDNRSLVDNNTAQTLSSDDIEAMKRNGLSGDAIVEALIANSSTFGKKTMQSQEKYILKKQKKYAPKLLLRRPSARSICETYLKQNADRTGFMRVDSLSLLLSMANVGAYSDVLVVDMVGGLVVGAVAERLGGTGYVCRTYLGTVPSSIDIVGIFNFSSDVTSRIVQSPLSDLYSLRNSGNAPCVLNDSIQGEADEPSAASDCKRDDCASVASTSAKAGMAPSSERMKYWREHGFSSLIVAAPEYELGSYVSDLLPLLSYSAPFAIYHRCLEPLATCMHSLVVSEMAVGLQISEPWLREYQVLPSRTHPHMKMNSFGGYILSGIWVRKPEAYSGE
ncbi:hypothetical protein BRADI_2g06310v3 [Brachypodium distachyon]|uniref:tRNA (adenine(58)-N(1))-methyltransferase non-catalytic subunit TRM6 n=1 Tax=Brachypodium distachyon TaxID=15368 RepID=A0A0Q3JXL1_BRADI|nr:hypothetical protein BRADI_2g06310v3 [Brachypodium distachyon]